VVVFKFLRTICRANWLVFDDSRIFLGVLYTNTDTHRQHFDLSVIAAEP